MNPEQKYFLERESERAITKYTTYAMGGGAIPVPLLDIAATTAIQVAMIKRLCEINGIEYKDEQSTALISAIASSFIGKFAASFVKAIPVIGWIFGIPAQVVASGILTHATGKAFMGYIGANKSIKKVRDFNVSEFMSRIKDNVDGGVDYLKDTLGKNVPDKVVDKLKNLNPEDSVQDVEQKLQDLAKEREVNKKSDENQGTEVEAFGRKVFKNNEEDFILWMNRPNKLSDGRTPKEVLAEGRSHEVISWLNVLSVVNPEYLDIPVDDSSSKEK